METRKIYVVYSFGGEYEDKWDRIECAFASEEAADSYIKEQKELREKVSDELFTEMEDYLAEKEYEMQCKYYDPNTAELYKDVNEEDYYAEYEEFHESTMYEFIKEKFNVDKEDYDRKSYDRTYDFVGYMKKEVDLFEK